MSLDAKQTENRPVTSLDELVEYFRGAERRDAPGLVGLEHEKFVYPAGRATPVPYEGRAGIGALLEGFRAHGWQEYREAPGLPVIAMTQGQATLSLEPGGQVELSGTPFRTARAAHEENVRHLEELRQVAAGLGLRAVALGYQPFAAVSQMPWMPKTRYQTMRETLGTRGTLAFDMMLLTATVQVSLDWRDEADCARKVTAASRVAPVVLALYANSPLRLGRPSGYLSFRSHVWSDVDPARCGYPPCALDGCFTYRRYAEWALDAPLLFLRRGGRYLAPKLTFRELLRAGWEGQPAQWSDWVDHLSTMFPEVRIKRVLEFRSADSNGAALAGALAALLRGLLYDERALGELEQALPYLSPADHLALHRDAQLHGLKATALRGTLADYARDVVSIAERGLRRLDEGDVPLLAPLQALAEAGASPAERVLREAGRAPADFLSQFEF